MNAAAKSAEWRRKRALRLAAASKRAATRATGSAAVAPRHVSTEKPLSVKKAVANLSAVLEETIALPNPPPWVKVSDALLLGSARKRKQAIFGETAFTLPAFPPRVAPAAGGMALDTQIIEVNSWAAAQVYNGAYANGQAFIGYTALAELAQIPEYRRITEVTATEMTRKWIIFKGGTKEKIKQLEAEMVRLDAQGAFRKMVELDGFFGRAHLYIDTGDTDNPDELKTSIGNGRDAATLAKFKGRTGFLKGIRPVEPVWCYPLNYTSNNPLRADWYNPQSWSSMANEIHVSRFLTFVGREVPDMLKPSYAFGGLSLSQMAMPYVNNWLRTRQAVADLIWSFSVSGVKTDLSTINADNGTELLKRIAFFANLRTNQGTMVLDMEKEEFFNVSVPLGGLHELQSQAQEQMCSVIGIPVVKFLGIQPAGMNASSEGELTTWYDWIAAFQEKFFSARLGTAIDFAQLNLWGEIDPTITFEFEPMRELTEAEQATVNKTKADGDVALVGAGILDPTEARERLSKDPQSGHEGIDIEDVPSPPGQPEEEGAAPPGDNDLSSMFNLGPRDPGAVAEREDRTREPRDGERRDDRQEGRGREDRKRAPREFERA